MRRLISPLISALSFGADAELLEPADKRKEVKEAIKQMASLYK